MRSAAFLALSFTLLAAAGKVTLPPAASGEINGRTAVLVWPASEDGELIEPSNCTAHLVPYSDQERELLFPCGQWFQPAVGKYRYWLEKDHQFISPYPTVLIYNGPKFTGTALRVVLPMKPAGRIALRAPSSAAQSFRLLHIPAAKEHPAQHRSMDRRAPGDEVKPLLMPEGDVIAGLFDRQTGDALALTRPVRVQRDQTAYVAPQPPKEGSDVLAVLDRPGLRPQSQTENAVLVLRMPEGDRVPDVLSDTSNRVIAVWYGVSGRRADLIFQSTSERVPTEMLRLIPGRVVTVRRAIAPLPAADIDIHTTETLGPLKLNIQTITGSAVRTLDIVPGHTRVENLPATELTVTLSSGEWRFTQKLDLTSGSDGRVTFDIEPLIVEGNVFFGDRAAAASVTFGTGTRELATTNTDADGHYRLTLLAPGTYVARIAVAEAEPFVKGFLDVTATRTDLDFHVPRNQIRVHVTDRRTGKAVPDASVAVNSIYSGFKQIESRRSDSDGMAILPPLRPGEAEIRASADGYREGTGARFRVDDETREQQVEIALEPFDEQIDLQLFDSTGLPAFGAELRLIAGATDDRPLWQATYESATGVSVPIASENALLLIRARGSASRVVPLGSDHKLSITLEPEAPPLIVRTEPFARSGMWFGPYRMTTMSLGFLTWSQSGIASTDGVWIARGLPRSSVRLFAWRRNTAMAVAGAFDALATTTPYPWPEVVRLKTAD